MCFRRISIYANALLDGNGNTYVYGLPLFHRFGGSVAEEAVDAVDGFG